MTEDIEVRLATDGERADHLDCVRCGHLVRREGIVDLRVGGHSGGWSVLFGNWADLGEGLWKVALFSCPNCGHIELRVPEAA